MSDEILHASVIALWRGGAWRGVLLLGPSGAGKSSLALSAADRGWRLVADDRAVVWSSGGRLFARPPEALVGLVEARGVGVVPFPILPRVELALAAELVETPEAVERSPEPESLTVCGASLPLVRLWAHEASAPAKLALACGGDSAWRGQATGVSSSARGTSPKP